MRGPILLRDGSEFIIRSADKATMLVFSFSDRGQLEVRINGEWLEMSPKEAGTLNDWLGHRIGEWKKIRAA